MRTFLRIFLFSVATTIVVFFALKWGMAKQGLDLGLHGQIAMAAGVFFTMALGAGLMALLFYSNRGGHDDVVNHFDPLDGPDK